MSGPSGFSPNPDEAQRAIQAVSDIDLAKVSIEEISQILEPLFMSYAIRAPKYEPGVYLFRGRILNERPANIGQLKHPPEGTAGIGRANDHGESIFYAATARSVPFFELHATRGQTIALSCWKTTDTILLNHIGFLPVLSGAHLPLEKCQIFTNSHKKHVI